MHRLALDFQITVICPLLMVAAITLASSIRAYRNTGACLRNLRYTLAAQIKMGEVDAQSLQQEGELETSNTRAWFTIRISAVALAILVAITILNDDYKVSFADGIWKLLTLVSVGAVLIALASACYFVARWNAVRFAISVLVVLLGCASAEHCFHQQINADHQVCPDCTDDDDRPDDY